MSSGPRTRRRSLPSIWVRRRWPDRRRSRAGVGPSASSRWSAATRAKHATSGNIYPIEPGHDAWIVGGEVSPDEATQAAVMDAWMAWLGEIGPSIVDMGSPFGATATIASNGSVSEGGGSDPATGYTVIEAVDLDAAVDRAKGCPGLSSGGTLKVYEAVQMG